MGSLLPGWDSPVLDPQTINSQRNKSFTKEEVENYWRLHKTSEEEEEEEEDDVPAILSSPKNYLSFQEKKSCQSNYSPKWETVKAIPEVASANELETGHKTDDWWTRSNWAFLNEPPQEEIDESSRHKYTAQFHVAEAATKKLMSVN